MNRLFLFVPLACAYCALVVMAACLIDKEKFLEFECHSMNHCHYDSDGTPNCDEGYHREDPYGLNNFRCVLTADSGGDADFVGDAASGDDAAFGGDAASGDDAASGSDGGDAYGGSDGGDAYGGGDGGDAYGGDYGVPVTGWVTITAGMFTMGSPDTEEGRYTDEIQHEVTLTRDFEIMSTEVTQGEFEALMAWNPSSFGPDLNYPVENLSWYDAVAYTNELSVQEGCSLCYTLSDVVCENGTDVGAEYMSCMNAAQGGIDSASVSLNGVGTPYDCKGYRLPTEAEWEYAARGGDPRATYNGNLDGSSLGCEQPNMVLDTVAWFCGNSGGTTHEKGGLAANAYGLYDMLGNVCEWCYDWDGTYPGTITDPMGPASSSYRVWRGGSWNNIAGYVRAALRAHAVPGNRDSSLGFRLVRSSL